jgi:hypothetical protein
MVVKGVIIGIAIVFGVTSSTLADQADRSVQSEQAQARYKIFVMEGVLEKAVQNGAAIVSRQVRSIAPDAMFLTGAAQVRGFRLDGFGVFFDVEVPALQPTVAWTLRAMLVDNGNSLAQLKAFVQKVSDPNDREELLRAIRQLELVMPSSRQAEVPGAPRQVTDRPPGSKPCSRTADRSASAAMNGWW